ncbi:MAG: hypothetical protein J3R72DRAFT_449706, partial [Linnemannia gamsii]
MLLLLLLLLLLPEILLLPLPFPFPSPSLRIPQCVTLPLPPSCGPTAERKRCRRDTHTCTHAGHIPKTMASLKTIRLLSCPHHVSSRNAFSADGERGETSSRSLALTGLPLPFALTLYLSLSLTNLSYTPFPTPSSFFLLRQPPSPVLRFCLNSHLFSLYPFLLSQPFLFFSDSLAFLFTCNMYNMCALALLTFQKTVERSERKAGRTDTQTRI